jgi:hypothetical protein
MALRIQHAMRMRHILYVTCPTLQGFSTLSYKRNEIRMNVYIYLFIYGSSCNLPVILVRF